MNKKILLFILICFLTKPFFSESFDLVKSMKNKYGTNKWFFVPGTDRWGDPIDGEGIYYQIVDGIYIDINGARNCSLLYINDPSKKVEIPYIRCIVFFDLLAPLFIYESSIQESFHVYARKSNNKDLEMSSTAVFLNLNSVSNFGFYFGDFQYTINYMPNLREQYEGLICTSEKEYLEIIVEGKGWHIKTQLFGPSPLQ